MRILRLSILVVIMLLLANAANASLQGKLDLGPFGNMEAADFVENIHPGHEYYLGYDFVGVRIYPNETARMAVEVVNMDNRDRSAMLIMNLQGRNESEVISVAAGSSKLVKSDLFPYESGDSFRITNETYDIFIELIGDAGQSPLRAKIKMYNETIGRGSWFTGLYG